MELAPIKLVLQQELEQLSRQELNFTHSLIPVH